jgi:hypothetical protein
MGVSLIVFTIGLGLLWFFIYNYDYFKEKVALKKKWRYVFTYSLHHRHHRTIITATSIDNAILKLYKKKGTHVGILSCYKTDGTKNITIIPDEEENK